MSARRTENGVVLEWRTGYEVDNLGFHVYRGPENGRVRLTTSLLAGSGLQQSSGIDDRRQPLVPLERRDGWRECPRRRVPGWKRSPSAASAHGTARSDRGCAWKIASCRSWRS